MRKVMFAGFVVLAVVVAAVAYGQRSGPPVVIDVYKTASCGCCGLWVEHLQANGFTTRVTDMPDLASVKSERHVPEALQTCHTAVVGGYVIEGHVPAREIRRVLDERPAIAGLAVPGMPVGSPGMESGSRLDPYDVLSFTQDGRTAVFASYGR